MVMSGGGTKLIRALLAGPALKSAEVAHWTLILCWRLSRLDENKVSLMVHVAAVMSVAARHGDTVDVVLAGLMFLRNESLADENMGQLMAHVMAVRALLTRHLALPAVVEAGLGFLWNESVAVENRVRLMAHVVAVMSSMGRH